MFAWSSILKTVQRSVSDAFLSSAGFSISHPAAFHAFQLPGTLRTSVEPVPP